MPGRRVFSTLASFALGQGATQGLSVVAGLYLVRHLSLEAYGQYGLALGFQAVVAVLTDMGFTGTIVPIIGDRKDDRAVVGRYVRAAKHMRTVMFWILAPLATVPFLLIMHKYHWSIALQIALVVCTLITLYSGGTSSCYSIPYVLHSRLREFYVPQVISGVVRLATYVGLKLLNGLNAWTAVGIAAAVSAVNALWFAVKGRQLVDWPDKGDPAANRELVRYVLPATPAMLFAAFQPQLTLFLISIFGTSTVYIAQVAALNRIAALFSVLMTFNVIVVEPRAARVAHHQIAPIFVVLCALTLLLCIPLVWIAFAHPRAFIWLIGSKYMEVRNIVGWVILGACINYLAGLIWVLNRSRRWIFWSGSVLEVGLLFGVQLLFVVLVGVHNTRQAVFLTLAASICPLIAHGYVTAYGFMRERRNMALPIQT